MRIIAHRGLLEGPDNFDKENNPKHLDEMHKEYAFDAEIDLRMKDGDLYLGHDKADYKITLAWLKARKHWLWIHCKDVKSLSFMSNHHKTFNYFFHGVDQYVITSKGYIWAYPGSPLTPDPESENRFVAVLPEQGYNDYNDVMKSFAICTDYPVLAYENFRKLKG